MTDTPDTSPGTVEAIAQWEEERGRRPTAALLRQLAKRNAELEATMGLMFSAEEVGKIVDKVSKVRNAALRQAAEKVMEFDRKPAKELWPLPIANAILALITSKPDEPTSETAGSEKPKC